MTGVARGLVPCSVRLHGLAAVLVLLAWVRVDQMRLLLGATLAVLVVVTRIVVVMLLVVPHLLVLLARIGSYSFELELELVNHVFGAYHLLLHLLRRRCVVAALRLALLERVRRLLLLQALFITVAVAGGDGCGRRDS